MVAYIFYCVYLVYITYYKLTDENADILNKKLITLKICGWNILHIIFYFILCIIFNVKTYRQ